MFVYFVFLWIFCLKLSGRTAGSGRQSKVSLARILRSAIHEIPVKKCAILLRLSDVFFSVESRSLESHEIGRGQDFTQQQKPVKSLLKTVHP
jgi:hypothetical protein